jgi:TM2 domain-containing membrane protein YozV
MLDSMVIMKDLNDQERLLFQNEFLAIRKNSTTAILLALLLGGLGIHHFYMGNVGLGVLYMIFCWTFIPAILGLIECLFMSGRVRTYNQEKAQQIAIKLKALRAPATI